MAVPAPVAADAPAPPRWGLGDAAAGWVLAYVVGGIASIAILAAAGYSMQDATDDKVPLWITSLASFPPLWLFFIGVPIWAAATKGNGWIRDFRVSIKGIDVLVGMAAGAVAQWILVPLVSFPILWITGKSVDDLSKPAQDLADQAHGAPNVLALIFFVAIGAPLAEELFFRGLVLRAVEKRSTLVVAVVVSSIVFGATHLEPLQFAALTVAGAVFALVSVRAGRLGPAIIAHMTFNGVSVITLLASR